MSRSLLLAAVWWSGCLLAAADADRTLYSFESTKELDSVQASRARIDRISRPGGHALRVDFEPAGEPQVEFRGPWNGPPAGTLGLEVTNPGDEAVAFSVEVADQAGARTSGHTLLPLRAHESASFALALNSPPPVEMGMRGEPAIPGFRLLAEDHRRVDSSRIASFRVFLVKPEKPASLVVDNVHFAPAVSYDRIVDEFGQFSRAEWPGKLHDAAEFSARRAAEEAGSRARPTLAGRDEYGGWAAGPQLEATGYFRAAKQGGKWWLVTPGGRLFFSIGLDCVNYTEGATVVEGRESLFTWLPAGGDPLAAHYGPSRGEAPVGLKIQHNTGREFNFYAANLERKYGETWRAEWQKAALARMRAWGFNTIANWSDRALYGNRQVPYTVTLGLYGELPEVSSGSDYWRHMFDVFDPRFARAVDASIRAQAGARRDDPWCLGYFVDNELSWGSMRTDRDRYGLALGALSLSSSSAAKRVLVDRLEARYQTIEKWNAAWGAKLKSWEELRKQPYRPRATFTPAMREDLAAYMKEFAGRYFRTIRDAVRKYDPHHLYLGTRFAGYTREEVEACAEYCDVISFNIYRKRLDPAQWTVLDGIDKPVIIGEFHMGALDRGMFHSGLVATHDQVERAAMYQDYVRSVADHPLFVGCHFFKYVDEPLTGRPGDGENYNIGFVTVTDTPYPEMVEAARAVHGQIYARHAGR